jgi:hypothetical protein
MCVLVCVCPYVCVCVCARLRLYLSERPSDWGIASHLDHLNYRIYLSIFDTDYFMFHVTGL